MEAESLALAQEIDFSMWALFARATLTVKIVMTMLIVASFWSWSIIIQKLMSFRRARAEPREAGTVRVVDSVSFSITCETSFNGTSSGGSSGPSSRQPSRLSAWTPRGSHSGSSQPISR